MKKFFIITTALIIITVIALTVFMKMYITPEKVKAYLIPAVEKSLNRKVSIGEIDINILKGIGLKDFTIKEADQKTDFLRCKNFILKFQLRPLLSRKVIIDKVIVASPYIRIERSKAGTYNFEDMGTQEAPEKVIKEQEGEAAETLPISLLVSKISIQNAKVSLTDLTKDLPDIKSTTDIEIIMKSAGGPEISSEGHININFNEIVLRNPEEKRIKNISSNLRYAVRIDLNPYGVQIDNLEIDTQNITASIKGAISNIRTAPEVDISINMPKVKAADIQELAALFTDLQGITLSGGISANASMTGNPGKFDTLIVNNSLVLDNVGIKYNDIHSTLAGNLKTALKSGNLHIDGTALQLNKIPLSITGGIKDLNSSPIVDILLYLPKTDPNKIQTLLAPFVKVEGLSLSGFLAAELTVKGKTEKPELLKAKGAIALEKLGVSYNEINALLNGKVSLDDSTMKIDLSASSGRNTASLKGSVNSIFVNPNIALNVYAKKLYLDEIKPAIKKQSAAPPPAKTMSASEEQSAPKEVVPLNLKLTAQGNVKVDSAVYKGLDMTDFVMKYQFNNNKLTISQMTANAGKGQFDLSSTIDFSKPGYTYSLSTKIDSLHAEEIVNAFAPKAKDKVFGTITSNLTLRGSGTLPKNIKKNLTANSDFNIKDGKISDAEIAKQLSSFVNVSELETIEFTKAEGTVKIISGVAKLNSIFTSKELSMDPKGNIGLDETLDLAFDLKLSPRLTDEAASSSIAKYMSDEGGWSTIPILVTGTISDPKYGPDIAKVGTKVLEKEVNKFLDNLLNKGRTKEEKPPQLKEELTSQEPVNPVENLLKQLPGLFNN